MRHILSMLAYAVCASGAMAAFTPITNITFTTVVGPPDQYLLTTLTAGGTTFSAGALGVGTSTGSPSSPSTFRMDNFDLNDVATGHIAPLDTVMFGGLIFSNQNGSQPDFFLFEAAGFGNPDDITVAAIFPDDTVGIAVTNPTTIAINGWGYTGFDMAGPFSSIQFIAGLCWDITDLKDAGGVNLVASTPIKGIRIAGPQGNGIDPLSFIATVPSIPPQASITTSISGGDLILNWPAGQGWTLETTTNVLGPWSIVPGAASPCLTPTTHSAQFFRLKQ